MLAVEWQPRHATHHSTKTEEVHKKRKKHRKDGKWKPKRSSSSSGSSTCVPISSTSSGFFLPSTITGLDMNLMIPKAKTKEPEPPVLHTVGKRYTQAVDFRIFRLKNSFLKYNDTVSIYVAKLLQKVMSQTKAQFIDSKELISIVGFLARSEISVKRKPCMKGHTYGFSPAFIKRHWKMR